LNMKNRIILNLLFFILSLCQIQAIEVIKGIYLGRNFIVDDDYNVYSDYDSHIIVKYSGKGERLLEIGRSGEGPGDIKRLGWFMINPKTNLLYVTEFEDGNKRISIFSTGDGKFMGSWSFEFDWRKWQGLPFIQFDLKGNIYLETDRTLWTRYKDFQLGSTENSLLKYSPDGKNLEELYNLKYSFNAEKGGKGNITIPFSNYLFWEICQDKIVIRENYDQYIKVYNIDGSLLKKLKLPFKKAKVSKADIEDWENWFKSLPLFKRGIAEGWYDFNFWKRNLPFPEYKPVSGGRLFVDSKGFIYSRKYPGYKGNDNLWAKINIENGHIKLISFPTNYNLKFIKDRFFYFSKVDLEGEEDTVIVKVEENDLSKLK